MHVPVFLSCLVLLISLSPFVRGDDLPWLLVRPVDKLENAASSRDFIIADEFGREVCLRGACFENEERNFPPWQRSVNASDYANGSCISNYQNYQEPPICEVDFGKGKYAANTSDLGQNDFAQARALGFNIIRLCLSWSSLEYTPGQYNATYLDRIEQLVDWAAEQDIYVILDMHEDQYSYFITTNSSGYPPFLTPSSGQDGAPEWAVQTDGWPALSIFGIGPLNLASMAAFQNFYNNTVVPGVPQGDAPGPGLQDHYIGAVASLARRFANRSTVAGFEIMNEPEPGTTLIDTQRFAADFLYPFYRRVVQAVTGLREGLPECPPLSSIDRMSQTQVRPGVTCAYPQLISTADTRHIFFAEPSAFRNTLDFSPEIIGVWTNYTNIVHTPHVYTHVFTIDAVLPQLNITWWPPSYSFAYDTAWGEANRMNSAVFVTEYGTGADQDDSRVQPTLDQAELHGTGGTIWSWKSNCQAPAAPVGSYCNWSWTMYEPVSGPLDVPVAPNAELYPQRERLMSRIHTRGALGEVLGYFYNVTTRSYAFSANASSASLWLRLDAQAASEGVWRSELCGGRNVSIPSSGWGFHPELQHMLPPGACSGGEGEGVSFAPESTSYFASLPRLLAANGSVTEIYLPRSISYKNASAGENAQLLGVTAWPDGSRSAFFRPLSPGVYSISVAPDAPVAPPANDPALLQSADLRFQGASADGGQDAGRKEVEGIFRSFLQASVTAAQNLAVGVGGA